MRLWSPRPCEGGYFELTFSGRERNVINLVFRVRAQHARVPGGLTGKKAGVI